MKNIVILISGRGSNMQAIVNAAIPDARIAAVRAGEDTGLEPERAREAVEDLIALVDYEKSHRDRAPFVTMLENRIAAQNKRSTEA